MNIIVCIKQVPDTTEVKLDQTTGTLIRDGVPTIINPDDKAGLELALQLKESIKAKITVITMGPLQAKKALREALAMGADEAYLLTDRVFAGADTWATSLTIAKAIENMDYDLIICGRQAIDGDTAQVGPQISEHLNIPQVTYCEEIEKVVDALVAKRQFEDGYYKIKLKTPCTVTALSECIKPRYMTVSGIIDSYNKEIKTITFNDLDIDKDEIGLKGSPTRVKKSMTKGVKPSGQKLELEPKEAAQTIIDKLREKHII